MKWIAAVLCLIAVLFIITNGRATASHHRVTHYHGWSAPDTYCQETVDSLHMQNCIKAQRVIYTTFPNATQRAAMEVSKCETGRTYNRFATNPSSRTAGLFQIHPGNVGRYVRWGNHHIIISHDLYKSWVNAKVALYMSQGGTDWGEWASVCRP